MMSSIDKSLKEFIENKLVVALEGYMRHVFPHLPQSDIEDFYKNTYQELLRDVRNGIAEDFLRIIPFTSDTALAYVDHVFRGDWTDRKVNRFQEEAIAALGNNAKEAFVQALVVIDTDIAQQLWDMYGPFNVQVTAAHDGFELDGSIFIPYRYEKIRQHEGHHLRKWLSLIEQSGATGLLELDKHGNSYFFDRKGSNYTRESNIGLELSDLPRFNHGRIDSPELMLHFQQLSQGAFPRAFTRIPCLVPLDTASFFESARVFSPNQRAHIRFTNEKHSDYFNLKEIPETYKVRGVYSSAFDFKLIASEAGDECLHDDIIRLRNILSKELCFGFEYPSDSVLCMIDVDDLLSLPIGAVNNEKMNRLDKFCQKYFDAGLLGDLYNSGIWDIADQNYTHVRAHRVSTGTFNQHSSVWEVLDVAARKPELLEELRQHFGEELFLSLFDRERVSTRTIMALYNNYGYNNSHYTIRMGNEIIPTLKERGFKFVADSAASPDFGCGLHDVIIDRHLGLEDQRDLIQMGLWPSSEKTKPVCLDDALKAFVRRPNEESLQAYLLAAGIEEVSKLAKSEPQWKAIQRVFSAEDIESVMHLMPKKLKRDRLERDFDL